MAAVLTKPFWFQLYVMRDRGFAASLIERAKNARCSASFDVCQLKTKTFAERLRARRKQVETRRKPIESSRQLVQRKPKDDA